MTQSLFRFLDLAHLPDLIGSLDLILHRFFKVVSEAPIKPFPGSSETFGSFVLITPVFGALLHLMRTVLIMLIDC